MSDRSSHHASVGPRRATRDALAFARPLSHFVAEPYPYHPHAGLALRDSGALSLRSRGTSADAEPMIRSRSTATEQRESGPSIWCGMACSTETHLQQSRVAVTIFDDSAMLHYWRQSLSLAPMGNKAALSVSEFRRARQAANRRHAARDVSRAERCIAAVSTPRDRTKEEQCQQPLASPAIPRTAICACDDARASKTPC